jgi:hypothetical protein
MLPAMQRAASLYNVPLDAFISLAHTESSGNPNAVGDRVNADGSPRPPEKQAYGLYQVQGASRDYWLGGADPMNPEAATMGLGKRLKSVLDSCNGDLQCLHFKYNTGSNSYDAKTVAQRTAKFPHLANRLRTVGMLYGDGTSPALPVAPTPSTPTPSTPRTAAPTMATASAVPLAEQVLGITQPTAFDNTLNAPRADLRTAMMQLSPFETAPAVQSNRGQSWLGF